MKKYLFVGFFLILFSGHSTAANVYVLYYKNMGSWYKGGTYRDFAACENARQYHWAGKENTRCMSESE